MALRISVDLDGLRWADLFQFIDLARNGGIGPDDQVDVITYGSDPMSVSLSARIYPSSAAFGAPDVELEPAGRPAIAPSPPPPASPPPNVSPFGYDSPPGDRGPASNGAHYPAFEAPGERPGQGQPALPAFNGGYDGPGERGPSPAAAGAHYPQFDGQGDRIGPGGAGGQFAGFEPVFDRQGGIKEPAGGGQGPVDSPYIEEFARLQEGLMRQARRPDEVRPERG